MKPIEMGKNYRYRNGSKATILTTERPDSYGYSVVSIAPDGTIYVHKKTGEGQHRDFNLVEVSPYEDFKCDDLVITCNESVRYFAYEKDGEPYCWLNGTSSLTTDGQTSPWGYVRKATYEEIEGLQIKAMERLNNETN